MLIVAENGRDGVVTVDTATLTLTRAQVKAGGVILDSQTDSSSCQVAGSVITFRKGDFNLPSGMYAVSVYAYTNDLPNGELVVGPGQANQMEMQING